MRFIVKLLLIIPVFLALSGYIDSESKGICKSSYEELFNFYLKGNNKHDMDSIENILYDSVLANPNKFFHLIEYLDTSQNTIRQEFKAFSPDTSSALLLRKRNVYLIDIEQNRTAEVNDSAIFENYLSEKNIKEFLLNKTHKDHLPEKKIIHIDYFDSTIVSKGGFIINANVLSDSINNGSSQKCVHLK